MKIAVTGARGMLGTDLCLLLRLAGHAVVACDTDAFDIANTAATLAYLQDARPGTVIHCAAYTNVDGCESDPERAFRVNAEGARSVAEACARLGARLIAVSTDFVFDGAKREPYAESDNPRPLSVYGASKLAGEEAIRAACDDHKIVRTAWLFGVHGKSFPGVMIDAARAGKSLRVVSDETGSPTYTLDLARTLCALLDVASAGTFHVVNSGICTRHEFALETLRLAGLGDIAVAPIKSADWPSPARRPCYSALRSERLDALGIAPLRSWQEALTEYVQAREGSGVE